MSLFPSLFSLIWYQVRHTQVVSSFISIVFLRFGVVIRCNPIKLNLCGIHSFGFRRNNLDFPQLFSISILMQIPPFSRAFGMSTKRRDKWIRSENSTYFNFSFHFSPFLLTTFTKLLQKYIKLLTVSVFHESSKVVGSLKIGRFFDIIFKHDQLRNVSLLVRIGAQIDYLLPHPWHKWF